MDNNDKPLTPTINHPEIVQPRANTEVVSESKEPRTYKKSSKSQIAAILSQHLSGVSQGQIAKNFSMTQGSISSLLARWKPILKNLGSTQAYEGHRAEFLTATEMSLVENINDPIRLRTANIQQLAIAFDKINNARRLEAGLSTSISQNLSLSFNVSEIKPSIKSDT